MDIYIVIGILPLIISIVNKIVFNNAQKARKMLYICMFVVLGTLFGLRAANVGTDTQYYINRYMTIYKYGISRYNQIYSSEIGFTIYNLLLTKIFRDKYQWLFLISGIFVMYSYGRFFYRHSRADALTLMMFALTLFPRSLNILRTELAIAFCLFAIDCVLDGKTKRAVILGFIALMFHTSILIMFPVIILLHRKFHIKYDYKIAIIGSIVISVSVLWQILVTNISFFSKYSVFLNIEATYHYRIKSFSIYAFYTVFIVFSIILRNYFSGLEGVAPTISKNKDKTDFELASMLYFVFFLGIVISQFIWILSRITDLYYVGYVLFIPLSTSMVFSKITKQKISFIMETVVYLIVFYISIRAIQSNIAGCYPYEFVNVAEAFT